MSILCNDNGLCCIGTYSNISDNDLDELVREAQNLNPNTGIRLTKGFLVAKGHRLQLQRIRDSLFCTDPVGILQRQSQTVIRRKYKVHEFYCCVMYSGVEYVVCCYSECISHTRQAEKSA